MNPGRRPHNRAGRTKARRTRGALAAAPWIPIAVAPIGFGPDNGLTWAEQAECELGKRLFEELHDAVGQSFAEFGKQ